MTNPQTSTYIKGIWNHAITTAFVKFSNFVSFPPTSRNQTHLSQSGVSSTGQKWFADRGFWLEQCFPDLFHFTARYHWAPISKQDNVAWLPEKGFGLTSGHWLTKIKRKHANLANEFSNHAIPGSIRECWAVLPISDLVDVILETQDLGQGIQNINGETLISLGLAQNVFCHHHKRLFLYRWIL